MKKTKIINQVATTILLLCIGVATIYATATIARDRRSPFLPWQGTPQGQFDIAHNVGGNNPAGEYLPDERFSIDSGTALTANGVIKDSITGLYWESIGNDNICKTFNTTEIIQKRNTNCGATTTFSIGVDCSYCAAQEYCETLVKGGFDDWRIPNPTEFLTLAFIYKSASPYYDSSFFNVVGIRSAYVGEWTSSPDMSNIDVNQWIYDIRDLSFKKQNVYAYNSAFYATTFVRCVRGPIRL